VYIVKDPPTSKSIRLTVQDSLGRATDGGEFINVVEHNKVVRIAMMYEQLLAKHAAEALSATNPELAKAIVELVKAQADTTKKTEPKATVKKKKK